MAFIQSVLESGESVVYKVIFKNLNVDVVPVLKQEMAQM